jgi:hypothetical protein
VAVAVYVLPNVLYARLAMNIIAWGYYLDTCDKANFNLIINEVYKVDVIGNANLV